MQGAHPLPLPKGGGIDSQSRSGGYAIRLSRVSGFKIRNTLRCNLQGRGEWKLCLSDKISSYSMQGAHPLPLPKGGGIGKETNH